MSDNVISNRDTPIQAAIKISKGNPGALTICMDLMTKYSVEGVVALCHLDDMAIRGEKIWVGFKDYCKQDLEKFFNLIMSRDDAMQEFIKSSQY